MHILKFVTEPDKWSAHPNWVVHVQVKIGYPMEYQLYKLAVRGGSLSDTWATLWVEVCQMLFH